jgi:hypothetical protein
MTGKLDGTVDGQAAPASAAGGDIREPPLGAEITSTVLNVYKRILTYQFIGAGSLIVALSAATLASSLFAKWQPPFLLLVMLYGILGAFFSALTRLYSYNFEQISVALISPIAARLEGRHLLMHSFVPLMVGAIASVALYWGFVSKLVEGSLFPRLSCKGEGISCAQLVEVLNYYGPTEAVDYGKMMIWAFIAGFSERFVPDLLQSIAMRTHKIERQDSPVKQARG